MDDIRVGRLLRALRLRRGLRQLDVAISAKVGQSIGAQVAIERFGWPLERGSGSRLLVVLDTSTNRRRVGRHDRTLHVAYPLRRWEIRRWLRLPVGLLRGLMFLPISNPGGVGRAGGA